MPPISAASFEDGAVTVVSSITLPASVDGIVVSLVRAVDTNLVTSAVDVDVVVTPGGNVTRDWVALSIAVDDSVVVLGVALDAVPGIGLGVGLCVAIGAGRGVGDGVGGVGRGVGGDVGGRGVARGVGGIGGATQDFVSHLHAALAVVQSRQLSSDVLLVCKLLSSEVSVCATAADKQPTHQGEAVSPAGTLPCK
jgi:hypothetical protein